MKSASNRIKIMWVFIALALAGTIFLVYSMVVDGGK